MRNFLMPKPPTPNFDTLSLHGGQKPDPTTGARATPIYQTASYVFKDTDYAVGLFNIERAGHVYSRLSNPTNAVLEERIALLDNGVGAIATASGQAAMHLAVCTILNAGQHVVASHSIYGGTQLTREFCILCNKPVFEINLLDYHNWIKLNFISLMKHIC